MRSALQLCLLALLIMMIGPQSGRAQDDWLRLEPECGGVFDLCGFIDKNTRRIVIPYQFEGVASFKEGLAAVMVEGRYGFIDQTGKLITPPKLGEVTSYHQGLAEVWVDGKAGVIDRSGKFVAEPQFRRAIPFTSSVLLVQPASAEDDNFFQKKYGVAGIRENGPNWRGSGVFGLYDLQQGWLVKPKFHIQRFEGNGRGLVWARIDGQPDQRYGLLRADGNWQVEPKFSSVDRLRYGRAAVSVSQRFPSQRYKREIDTLWGAVDEIGQVVIPLKHERQIYFSKGFSEVKVGELEGVMHPDGSLVGGRLFQKVDTWSARVLVDGTWMSFKPNGKLVPDRLDRMTVALCPNSISFRSSSGKYEIYGPDNKKVNSKRFDEFYSAVTSSTRVPGVWSYDVNCGNPIGMRLGNRWSFVDVRGQLIADPMPFEDTHPFENGHAWVKVHGKWGLVNQRLEFLAFTRYDGVLGKNSDLDTYLVKVSGREFWIDVHGNEVPKPKFKKPAYNVKVRQQFLTCSGGARYFERDGRWGLKGPGGRVLVEPVNRALSCFRNGLAWVTDDSKRVWCPVGTDGKLRDKPDCKEKWYPYYAFHSHHEPFHRDKYESNVLWVRARLEFGIGRRDEPPGSIQDPRWSSNYIYSD